MLLTGGMGRAATMRQSAIGMRAPIATVPGVHSLAEAAARSARSAASSATSLAPPPPPGGPRARSSARAPSSGRGPAPARAGGFLGGLFRQDPAENTRRKYQERVDRVNALEPALAPLDDAALREKTAALRKRAQAGEALDALLPEAFAVSVDCLLLFGWGCVCRVTERRRLPTRLIGRSRDGSPARHRKQNKRGDRRSRLARHRDRKKKQTNNPKPISSSARAPSASSASGPSTSSSSAA